MVRRGAQRLAVFLAVVAAGAYIAPATPAHANELPTITDRFTVGTFPNSVAISRDGARIVTSNSPYSGTLGTTASVVTRSTRGVASVTVGTRPQGVAITPDGTQAYISNYNGSSVSVVTLATASLLRTLSTGISPTDPAVTGDGTTLLVPNGGLSSVVSKFSVASGAGAGDIGGATGPACLTPNSDGTLFFVCLNTTTSIGLFSASDAAITSISVGDFNCSSGAFSPDGTTLYSSCSGTGLVAQINATTRTWTRNISVGASPGRLVVNPAGTRVFVVRPDASLVTVIQAGGSVLANTSVTGTPRYIGVSNDGRYVLVATDEGNLIVLDSTGTQVLTTLALGGTPTDLEVARSGDFAAVSLSSTNEVVTIGLPRSDSGTGSSSSLPTGPLQQYVPASGEVCGTNPPGSVDFPGLVELRNQGWGASWAQWPNGGRGGTVCSREPFLTPSGQWAVR